jgi:hypothetical protein
VEGKSQEVELKPLVPCQVLIIIKNEPNSGGNNCAVIIYCDRKRDISRIAILYTLLIAADPVNSRYTNVFGESL